MTPPLEHRGARRAADGRRSAAVGSLPFHEPTAPAGDGATARWLHRPSHVLPFGKLRAGGLAPRVGFRRAWSEAVQPVPAPLWPSRALGRKAPAMTAETQAVSAASGALDPETSRPGPYGPANAPHQPVPIDRRPAGHRHRSSQRHGPGDGPPVRRRGCPRRRRRPPPGRRRCRRRGDHRRPRLRCRVRRRHRRRGPRRAAPPREHRRRASRRHRHPRQQRRRRPARRSPSRPTTTSSPTGTARWPSTSPPMPTSSASPCRTWRPSSRGGWSTSPPPRPS